VIGSKAMAETPGAWVKRRWLAVASGLGVTCALAQVVLLRELLVGFRGNELSLGISLAAWLLWVAVGSAVGGRALRRTTIDEPPGPAVVAAFALLLLGALPIAGIWFARDLRELLHIGWGEFIPMSRLIYAAALLVAPVGFAAGIAFPVICRAAQGRVAPARIYLAESIGFLVGGVASFAMADHVLPFPAAFATAAIGAIAAMLAAWRVRGMRAVAIACTAAGVVGLLAGVPARLESASLRRLFPGQHIVASEYSRYGNWVALTQGEQFSLYHNGALAFSAPEPMAAETLAHLTLLEHPDPRRVMLVGGGVDGTAAEILKHRRIELDYVELDPAVIKLARDCPGLGVERLMRHPRLHFSRRDGRLFVKRAAPQHYDVIIVNLPEPSTALLNRFYTLEFFGEARRALTRRGVLCLGLPSAENYMGPEMQTLLGSVYQSLRRVFADVVVTPGDHSYFFASPSTGFLTADARTLSERWQRRAVPVHYFGPYYIESILLPERVESIRRTCESAPRLMNRDFRPVGYFYDVAVAGLTEGLLRPGALRRLSSAPWSVPVAAGLILLGAPYVLSRRGQRARRGAIIAGIAAAGLAGMTLEVCLLFAFQVMNGHVYAQVGALIALFMAGLASGTWLEGRAVARGASIDGRWLSWLIAGCVVAGGTPQVLAVLDASSTIGAALSATAIAALMVAGGAVVGALFPLGVRMLGDSAGAAGSIYAADLAGAAVGAIVTSVVALPLLGLAGTCYWAAAVVAVAIAIGVLATLRRQMD
jgi:spermidine synthase